MTIGCGGGAFIGYHWVWKHPRDSFLKSVSAGEAVKGVALNHHAATPVVWYLLSQRPSSVGSSRKMYGPMSELMMGMVPWGNPWLRLVKGTEGFIPPPFLRVKHEHFWLIQSDKDTPGGHWTLWRCILRDFQSALLVYQGEPNFECLARPLVAILPVRPRRWWGPNGQIVRFAGQLNFWYQDF